MSLCHKQKKRNINNQLKRTYRNQIEYTHGLETKKLILTHIIEATQENSKQKPEFTKKKKKEITKTN